MRFRMYLAALFALNSACTGDIDDQGIATNGDEAEETEGGDVVRADQALVGIVGPIQLAPLTLCPSNVDPQINSATFAAAPPGEHTSDANIFYASGDAFDITVVARNCTNADLYVDDNLVPTVGGGIDPPSTLHTIVSSTAVAGMPGFSRVVHRLHRKNLGQGHSHTLRVTNRASIVSPGNTTSSSQAITLVDVKEVEGLARMSVSHSELLNAMGRTLAVAIGEDGTFGTGSGHLYDFHWNNYFFELLPSGDFHFQHHMMAYVPNACDPDVYIDGKFRPVWNEGTEQVDIAWQNGEPSISFDAPWYCDVADFITDAFLPKMIAKALAIGKAKEAVSVGINQLIKDVIPSGCTGADCELTVMSVTTDAKALHIDMSTSARHFKVYVPYHTFRFGDPAGQGIAFMPNRTVSIVAGGIASVGGVKYPYPAYVGALSLSAGGLSDFDNDTVVTSATLSGSDAWSIRASMHFLDRVPSQVFMPGENVASLVGRLEFSNNTNLSNAFAVGNQTCFRTRNGGASAQDRLVLVPNDGPAANGSERGTGGYEASLILTNGTGCSVPLSAPPPIVIVGGGYTL